MSRFSLRDPIDLQNIQTQGQPQGQPQGYDQNQRQAYPDSNSVYSQQNSKNSESNRYEAPAAIGGGKLNYKTSKGSLRSASGVEPASPAKNNGASPSSPTTPSSRLQRKL
ncbi:unnamed protein product [[Candida] boidinii]|nr:unnamed protein product [[Candida] boidinii]